MANELSFVDSIASAPTTRLDLNDGTLWNLYRDSDFSPPPVKRARVSTLLGHGDEIPITTYGNRTIGLTLEVKATTKDLLAAELQKLNRELDRASQDPSGVNNILRWKATGAGSGKEVFFRVFPSPDYKLDYIPGGEEVHNSYIIRLKIEAEPFAYGLRVLQSLIVVNNDPAAGSNPCQFDVTGVTGDVATPGFFLMTGTTQQDRSQLMSIRRHGTPGGVYITQAEAMTQGTDTTVQANDATASGAGSNYSRTTFATVQALGLSARLSFVLPAAGNSVEYRGIYRIFVRVRRSDATTAMQLQMRDAVGALGIVGPIVTLPLQTYWMWIDIGLIALPLGADDPVNEGYNGLPQLVTGPSSFVLDAGSASATPDLDWDVVLAAPADEELSIINWKGGGANTDRIMDGPTDKCYSRNGASSIPFQEPVARTGDIPLLAPNQTNRIAFLRNVGGGVTDDKTLSQQVTVVFWPRFLYIRP